jgi:hypothetical protein
MDLEGFYNYVASTNPFIDNRVNGPAPAAEDVVKVHERAFARLTALAEEAGNGHHALGAVLWGEAGIGKSHLLARLERWAAQDKWACFVYLHNLQSSPQNLPRSLLRAVIHTLTRGRTSRFAGTALFDLVGWFIHEALQPPSSASSYSSHEIEKACDRLLDQVSERNPALVDREVYAVLVRYFLSAYRERDGRDEGRTARLAVRWLSGDYLDRDEADELMLEPGRHPDEPVALADNQRIKLVLIALTRLARSRRQPFLLCFDQVDNLETEQAAALSRFLEALLDSTRNLLTVVAGVQASLVQWRAQRVFQDSAWDRLGQFEIALQRIPVLEGCEIVAERLKHVLAPFAQIQRIAELQKRTQLFPLGPAWVEDCLEGKIEVRPREVLSWAREGWRREQDLVRERGGLAWLAEWGTRPRTPAVVSAPAPLSLQEVIDRKVNAKFDEHKAKRLDEPYTLPQDADSLAGLVYSVLEQAIQAGGCPIADVDRPTAKPGNRPTYDLLVGMAHSGEVDFFGSGAKVGLAFIVTESKQSAALILGRLARDGNPPERVVVITDERQPLSLAAKGREYFETLCARGRPQFEQLTLTLQAYAELEALQETVRLSVSGDLEVEMPDGKTRPVSKQEVIESHQRQGRYAGLPIFREWLALADPAAKMT